MSSSTCFQHSPIIDSSTATIVCQNCARVIEERLTHFEVNQQKYHIPQGNLKDEKKGEKIDGVKPITAKDIILTHYTCITDFSFEDVKQMNHKINTLGQINFSPSTTAAGVVYLYAKNVKCKKQTLQQVSSLFRVTSMSIQRFIRKYKMFF